MHNRKLIIIAVSVFVLVVLAVIVGLSIYNSNKPTGDLSINRAYIDCMKNIDALNAKNKAIWDEVDAEIFKCIRNYNLTVGITDGLNCIGTDLEGKGDCNYDTERYSKEVEGYNKCIEKKDELSDSKGYDASIKLDCLQYTN